MRNFPRLAASKTSLVPQTPYLNLRKQGLLRIQNYYNTKKTKKRMDLHKIWNNIKLFGKTLWFLLFYRLKKPYLFQNSLNFRNNFTNYQRIVQDKLHKLHFLGGKHFLMLRYSEANLLTFQIRTKSVFKTQKRTPMRTLKRTWSPSPPTIMPRLISR